MQALDNNLGVLRGGEQRTGNVAAVVQGHLEAAKGNSHLDKKREAYNLAYVALRQEAKGKGLSEELQKKLFELLEVYAAKTCYAQASKELDGERNSVDPKEGYRKSARLMELSLLLQLKFMGLTSQDYAWADHGNLEDLIASLETGREQEGKFFPFVRELQMDAKALAAAAGANNLREIVKTTLIRMTFSHQNIPTVRQPALYAFHQKTHDWTVALIQGDSIAEKREMVMYAYNRCSLLADLREPDNWKAKVESYDPVITLMEGCYDKNDAGYLSRIAQIANIRGLIILKSGIEDARTRSQPMFEEAFAVRSRLLAEATDDDQRRDHEFLLSNIRSALVDNLLAAGNVKEALKHAVALQEYINKCKAEGNHHDYDSSWTLAIRKAQDAFNALASGNAAGNAKSV